MRKPQFKPKHEALPMRIGALEITKTGVSRFDLRDPYHLAVTMRWPQFFVALFLVDLTINLIFAVLYWLQPGSILNAGPSLVEAFFFSIETLATVGYGVLAPGTLYGHIISSAEIFCCVAFTALVTGLIFIRFSKPRAKFRFAEVAVVTRYNGKPMLMVRVGNGRLSLLTDAWARVTVVLRDEAAEHHMRRVLDLELVQPRLTVFALTWNLMHVIDESSPLFGLTAGDVPLTDLRLIVFLEARDPALAATVQDLHDYSAKQILFGMRYRNVLTIDERGRANVDLNRISEIETDAADGHMPNLLN